MKNIFIAYISKFSPGTSKRVFSSGDLCSTDKISAVQTNEAAFKCFADHVNGENIRVIKILSEKAEEDPPPNEIKDLCGDRTADEYFSDVAREYTDDIIAVRDYSENEDSRDPAPLISEICSHISDDDKVYIDTTGGPRTTANMIQLLTKILRYKGIENPASYYTNIQNDNVIEDTKYFNELTDIADGINEFVHSGRSEQLQAIFSEKKNTDGAVTELISEMKKFADNIRLCCVDDLSENLRRLSDAIEAVEKTNAKDTYTAILKELLPVIRNKFFTGSDNSKADYFRIIRWCVDNGFIQQALTIFTEKMPVYLFEKGILSCSQELLDKQNSEKKSPLAAPEAYTNIFYSELIAISNDEFEYFKSRVKNECRQDNNRKTEEYVIAFLSVLKRINNYMKSADKTKVSAAIGKLLSSGSSCNEKEKHILNVLKRYDFGDLNSADKVKSSILNNKSKAIYSILNIPINGKTDSFSNKIAAVRQMETGKYLGNKEITINIPLNVLAEICTACLYVKATRNRINHALEEEKLSVNAGSFFKDRGYQTGFDVDSISKNLSDAFICINNAVSMLDK